MIAPALFSSKYYSVPLVEVVCPFFPTSFVMLTSIWSIFSRPSGWFTSCLLFIVTYYFHEGFFSSSFRYNTVCKTENMIFAGGKTGKKSIVQWASNVFTTRPHPP